MPNYFNPTSTRHSARRLGTYVKAENELLNNKIKDLKRKLKDNLKALTTWSNITEEKWLRSSEFPSYSMKTARKLS